MDSKQIPACVQSFINEQISNLANIFVLAKSEAPEDQPEDFSHGKDLLLKLRRRNLGMKYRIYSNEFKVKAVNDVVKEMNDNKESITKIIRCKARRLGIHPKNLQRWYRCINLEKREGRRGPAYPEMENELIAFLEKNPKLKRRTIIQKAKEIMRDNKYPNYEQFHYSKGWYERFRDRCERQRLLRQNNEAKEQVEELPVIIQPSSAPVSQAKQEASSSKLLFRITKERGAPLDEVKVEMNFQGQ